MDSRCKARFDPGLSSYFCKECSRDCLVNKATKMGKKRGYDVFIVPGGSGIRKIINKHSYEGVVGVACTEELKLGLRIIKHYNIPGQAVPLIKNGCSGTKFSMETLTNTL